MKEKIQILFLSANPWTTSRILVDEEAREIFERLQEGPCRDQFELHKHAAIRPIDFQRLLMMYEPHIVHFSGHASKSQKIILDGTPGRGKEVDQQGLVEMLGLYRNHVRLVLLNACFTRAQAHSLSEVIDYSIGSGKGIGDKGGVAFAGAFYRALGFGKSIREAFESAQAELALTRMPRTKGLELFVREGLNDDDPFPQSGLGINAADPWRFAFDLSASYSGGCDMIRGGTALLREDPALERTARGETETPVFETADAAPSGQLILHETENRAGEQSKVRVSSAPAETSPAALGLQARGKKNSQSALTNFREAKRRKKGRSKDEFDPQSSISSSCVYTSVAVTVRGFLRIDVPHGSHRQTAENQTSLTRAGLGNKRLHRDANSESVRSVNRPRPINNEVPPVKAIRKKKNLCAHSITRNEKQKFQFH